MMKTIIAGDITVYEPSQEIIDWCEENLILTNPVYTNLLRRGQQATIERKHVSPKIKCYSIRYGAYIIPYGCLRAIYPMVKGSEVTLNYAEDHHTAFGQMPCAVDLFDYQKEAVEKMLEAKGGILKAGCGSGKTYIGIEMLRRLGLRFLWLCGKTDLLNQTLGNFKKLYPDLDVGTITDGEVNMGKDGTISTVQTLVNVDYRLYENEFNVVIVDEVHLVTANPATRQMYAKVLARCKAKYKYGLTATPARQDGLVRLIYAHVGMSPRATFRPSFEIKDSKTQSLQSKYEAFELDTPSSYSYLGLDGTIDFNELLNYLQSNDERNLVLCEKIAQLQKNEHRKIAVLSYRKDHVYALESILKDMGIKCGSVTGKTSKKERKGILSAPDDWDVILSTVHLFKEGLDIKALDTVFIALPFKDAIGIQQSEGRAERPMDGKNEPLFVFAYDKNIPYCETVEKKMRRIVNRKRK